MNLKYISIIVVTLIIFGGVCISGMMLFINPLATSVEDVSQLRMTNEFFGMDNETVYAITNNEELQRIKDGIRNQRFLTYSPNTFDEISGYIYLEDINSKTIAVLQYRPRYSQLILRSSAADVTNEQSTKVISKTKFDLLFLWEEYQYVMIK